MAEVAPAPAKVAKKKSMKPKKAGPSVSELIVKVVATSKEHSGVSTAALKKTLAAGGYDVDKNKSHVKTTIKSLVTNGIGTFGSFKMNKQADSKAKKPAMAKKPKKAAAAAKKTAKSPKKLVKKAPAKKAAPKKK
ncbi:histone H1-like [Austrofundulus limnaeus]|uniref:Histone H1-like n=1 Tax=Austrofundulus limnaeus TaxID=52670 RepID=A0A2I4D7S6_AUSLI|nr:PREDICTED: histone H1-like [Austrofundulus limnaeus]